jgi:hypothetical protein
MVQRSDEQKRKIVPGPARRASDPDGTAVRVAPARKMQVQVRLIIHAFEVVQRDGREDRANALRSQLPVERPGDGRLA